ncbi:MAG: hypothetical protein ACP5I8_04235 [Phycisphaerae bacterium]
MSVSSATEIKPEPNPITYVPIRAEEEAAADVTVLGGLLTNHVHRLPTSAKRRARIMNIYGCEFISIALILRYPMNNIALSLSFSPEIACQDLSVWCKV